MSNDKTMVRTRKNRENPYVMLDKTGLHDQRLSWKAKGLHAYLMSLPDDWTIYITELTKHTKDGRDSTRAAFKELELAGYVTNEAIRNSKGRIEKWEKIVYEQPLHWEPIEKTKSKKVKEQEPETENPYVDPETDFPDLEKPHLDNPDLENPTLLINNSTNNDLTNNGWLGEVTPSQNNPPSSDQALAWNLLKDNCEHHGIDKVQSFEFYKVWQHYYPEAPIPIVLATIRELMNDKWTQKNGKWTELEYKNVTGIFHHRMKSWRQMAAAYEDVDGYENG